MIDLHMHSTFSDGTDTPAQLIDIAVKKSIHTIALTDHDTLSGIPQLVNAAKEKNVRALGGVEISLEYNGRSLHMLGYLVDPNHEPLKEAIAKILDGREGRNDKIVAKLQELGIDITMEDILEFAGEEVIARPHFAKALLKKGAVQSMQQAFDEYLASGAKAYVDRFRLELDEGIQLIRDAGGVPVLAHPALIKVKTDNELKELVAKLTEYGLIGIEVHYSLHSDTQIKMFKEYAKEFGLIETGGSDYHGTNKPEIKMDLVKTTVCESLIISQIN